MLSQDRVSIQSNVQETPAHVTQMERDSKHPGYLLGQDNMMYLKTTQVRKERTKTTMDSWNYREVYQKKKDFGVNRKENKLVALPKIYTQKPNFNGVRWS